MSRLLLVAAVALALPAAALAKGPSEATISGPELDGELTLTGPGADWDIVPLAGFFEATFGQSPGSWTLASPPKGVLGPKYRITWTVPGPSGSDATIVQDVYPYATPNPVTYTRPGQRFFDTQSTVGGWFVSTPALRELLVDAGLPAEPSAGGRLVWPWLVLGLALGLAACLWLARSISITRAPSASSASTSSTPTTG